MSDNRVSLKDAISRLRKDLIEAAAAAPAEKAAQFKIDDVEVELTLVLEDTSAGGLEFNWWVLKAKADLIAKDSVTHKVKLKLNVGDIYVGDVGAQIR